MKDRDSSGATGYGMKIDLGEIDFKTASVLLISVIVLSLQYYFFQSSQCGSVSDFLRFLGAETGAEQFEAWRKRPENREIAGLGYWAFGRVATFIFIPLLFIRLAFREPLKNYGTRVRGIGSSLPAYAAMFVLMVPAVWFFSRTDSFQQKYPFYDLIPGEALWPRFWIWQVCYALQFVALEFFFRGFMVHGTKHRLGVYSVFVMTVPYVMIHFGKPFPETMGAVGAGLILGYMSLKTGSIWFGAALHIAVALTMDMLSLYYRGIL